MIKLSARSLKCTLVLNAAELAAQADPVGARVVLAFHKYNEDRSTEHGELDEHINLVLATRTAYDAEVLGDYLTFDACIASLEPGQHELLEFSRCDLCRDQRVPWRLWISVHRRSRVSEARVL